MEWSISSCDDDLTWCFGATKQEKEIYFPCEWATREPYFGNDVDHEIEAITLNDN